MTDDNQIWVVDDDNSIRWVIEKALSGDNIACKTFETADELLGALEHDSPKAIISDIRMPGMDGLTLLRELKAIAPDTPVIITTAHSDLDSAVTSYESGAFEYLPKPFDIDEMLEVASRALAYTQKEAIDQAGNPNSGKEIIGNAPAMQEVFRAIGRLSQSAITVLISGQSGSGKELVARALHQHSPRAKAPFVALNMAAIPKDLMESELFGHEKGSFTGAAGRREGRFEQANGGTVFLDEIGDMPHETQTRLLRVLAEGEFFRVGGATAIKTDVRVIAATHQDLRGLVAEGSFREDLYHRLNVIGINVPRLAERREDIPLLLNHFLTKAASELGVPTKELSPQVRDYLTALEWPGNVRQLRNVVERTVIMAPRDKLSRIEADMLPPEIFNSRSAGDSGATVMMSAPLREARESFEREYLRVQIRRFSGNISKTAAFIGMERSALHRKLKLLGMSERREGEDAEEQI